MCRQRLSPWRAVAQIFLGLHFFKLTDNYIIWCTKIYLILFIQNYAKKRQLPPLKGVAWMVTLKGSFSEYFSPLRRKERWVHFLLFSFERKENKKHKPSGNIISFSINFFFLPRHVFGILPERRSFSFLPSQQKRKHIFPLRTLRLERSGRWCFTHAPTRIVKLGPPAKLLV